MIGRNSLVKAVAILASSYPVVTGTLAQPTTLSGVVAKNPDNHPNYRDLVSKRRKGKVTWKK